MKNQKYAILMTACIKPSDLNIQTHSIHRNSPDVRLNDYVKALKFWLKFCEPLVEAIVFVENSGYDLSELKEVVTQNNICDRKVEFLQFKASEIPYGLHYGYSELEIIDYAFNNSIVLQQSKFVIKVTGRLVFPNIHKLIGQRFSNCDFIADCRDFKLLSVHKHYIISTFFIVEKDFYMSNLYNMKVSMSALNCGHLESLYYKILKPLSLKDNKKIMIRLPFNVEPVGIGAHWGISYLSYKKRLPSFLRALGRQLIPRLWI